MSATKRRPSPATVIALIALFCALGGTSYAAFSLPRNSVGTKQIKNGAVTYSKIDRHAKSSLRGQRGPAGRNGTNGAPGIANIIEVDGAEANYPSGSYGGAPNANCPAGSVVVGTGFNGPFNDVGGFVLSFHTFVGGFFANDSPIDLTGNVQAICARVGSSASSATRWRAMRSADLRRYHAAIARAEARAARH